MSRNAVFILVGTLVGTYFGTASVVLIFLPALRDIPLSLGISDLRTLFNESFPPRVLLLGLFLIALGGIFGGGASYALLARGMLLAQTRRLSVALGVNRTKDEFISMVLHHLRTPLVGIKWSLKDLLKESDVGEQSKEALRRLYGENERALSAADHLIEAAQASMERIHYDFEVISLGDLVAIIKKSIEALEPAASNKGLLLTVALPLVSEKFVKVDRDKIATIVQTLFQNAIQFTQKGSITIGTEERGSGFFLHITDTGAGIPQEDQPKIFLQFFRAKNARRLEPGGFGIGLFLAKSFLERHKGKISFASAEGRGTTFSLYLPVFQTPTEKFLEDIK